MFGKRKRKPQPPRDYSREFGRLMLFNCMADPEWTQTMCNIIRTDGNK